MFGVTTSDDYKPVTYWGNLPVDVTTILVAVHSVCAVLTALLMMAGQGAFLNLFPFDSAYVLHGFQIWRLATYAFIHSPAALIWFVVEMYMLFVFGREVERFIGRRAFLGLYALLLLLPTALLTLVGLGMRVGTAGSGPLHLGVFLAFATIYPAVEMSWIRIQMKWIALIFVGIYTLTSLAGRDWETLLVLWSTALAAFLFIRSRGVGAEIEWWNNLKAKLQPKPKFQVVPRATARRVVEPEDVYESIDPLLDKISRSGINSLTASERRALDRARNQLLKKPQ